MDRLTSTVALMTRDEIKRRLHRMTGPRYVKRITEVTRADLARHFGVDERLVRAHQAGRLEINDFWQIAYSQIFALLDSGEMALRVNEQGKKVLTRVPKPATVKKTARPFVDLTAAHPRLAFD